MTKQLSTQQSRNLYCVRFSYTACYKIHVTARDEKHAIRLAKRRWFYGNNKAFAVFAGETDGWDAELEEPPPLAR
jgi:hypothetical protein